MEEIKKAAPELECSHCGTTSELTPILTYIYQGEEKQVCTHCLPMLIHGQEMTMRLFVGYLDSTRGDDKMIASVDKSKCIGCGLCEGTCPQVFRMGDDGLFEAYTNPIPSESEDTAQEAAYGCPVEAITIE